MICISLTYVKPARRLVAHMRIRSPSLNFLRTFEAVARNRSFTQAAEELCITQAAVSQQVRLLEKSLGAELFNRAHRRPTLTHAGEILLPAVSSALQQVASATEEIHALHANREVRLNLSRFFLAHWLEARLDGFVKAHPELDLAIRHFYQSLTPEAFARDEVDLAVIWGRGSWPGLVSALLFHLDLTPVCSPSILRAPGPAAMQDLRRYTLLRSYHDWWSDWAQHTRLDLNHQASEYIADYDELVQAALDGRGVALVAVSLGIAQYLHSGHLIKVSDITIPTQEGYHVVGPAEAMRRPAVSSFRDWLVASALSERNKLDTLQAQYSA